MPFLMQCVGKELCFDLLRVYDDGNAKQEPAQSGDYAEHGGLRRA